MDHACTTRFVFANSFGKSFQKLFANSQRYMNKIARIIFKIWNFLSLFQMLFLWLNKTPLKQMLLLVFKRVLPILQVPNWIRSNTFRYQFEKFLKIWNWWWCGPFALGLIFSPPLALSTKNGERWSPFYFLPNDTK